MMRVEYRHLWCFSPAQKLLSKLVENTCFENVCITRFVKLAVYSKNLEEIPIV